MEEVNKVIYDEEEKEARLREKAVPTKSKKFAWQKVRLNGQCLCSIFGFLTMKVLELSME